MRPAILSKIDLLDSCAKTGSIQFHGIGVKAVIQTPVQPRTFANQKPGIPGSQLLEFAGLIEASELALMSEAIETSCRQVDEHEW